MISEDNTYPPTDEIISTLLSSERNAVAEYETAATGRRLSTSLGGSVTGQGANLIIVDDPIKADEAQSDARQQWVNNWYDNTLRGRLDRQTEGDIVIVMQRLHAGELVAHLMEQEEWDGLPDCGPAPRPGKRRKQCVTSGQSSIT